MPESVRGDEQRAVSRGLCAHSQNQRTIKKRPRSSLRYDRLGIIDSVACEGCALSTYTRLVATRLESARPSGSAVLGLTSKCGKLLLEMSIRMRCPRLNKLLVGNASTRIA